MRHLIYGAILSLMISSSFQIVQKCEGQSSCPKNSFCNENKYCECEENWALNCNYYAPTINKNNQTFELPKNTLFKIVPYSDDAIYFYKFNLCCPREPKIYIGLYADEGTQSQLNRQNKIGDIELSPRKEQCTQLFSPYMTFNYQPNGRIQQMILQIHQITRNQELQQSSSGLYFQNQDQKSGKTHQNRYANETISITLSVDQIFFIKLSTLNLIIIIFISFFALIILTCVGYCIYQLRTGGFRNSMINNDIKYFDQQFPRTQLKADDELIGHSCSICLLQYKKGQKIRKTLCKHTFHYECIDQWCKKNLTCPVCRKNLSKKYIQQQKRLEGSSNSSPKVEKSNINKTEFQQQQLQLQYQGKKTNIKQRLLQ